MQSLIITPIWRVSRYHLWLSAQLLFYYFANAEPLQGYMYLPH
jgi:hypothetical protein